MKPYRMGLELGVVRVLGAQDRPLGRGQHWAKRSDGHVGARLIKVLGCFRWREL